MEYFMNNEELKNSIIISRRPLAANEFVFRYNVQIGAAKEIFNYIERLSNISIEEIPREELPHSQGFQGWRVTKK